MKRLIAVILLAVLLIYSIYMAYSQPRAPVVVVRPQQAQPETQTSPPAQVQPAPPSASCTYPTYLKAGNTQLCGIITSLSYTTAGYQIAMKSGWISGQFIIVTPPACSISTAGSVVNIPCGVEVLIPARPAEPSAAE